jgi:hypothetical protein
MRNPINLRVGTLWLRFRRTAAGAIVIRIDDPWADVPPDAERVVDAETWAALIAELAELSPDPALVRTNGAAHAEGT